MAGHEGILLDPTSSGKAFAAVLDMIKEKKIKLGRQVIFLHDGSMAGLYEKAHRLKLEKKNCKTQSKSFHKAKMTSGSPSDSVSV